MYKIGIAGIFFLAFLLRFSHLSSLPLGFTPDEASFGYDAYSLLKTGHDQWGIRYPLTFKSFGDYKLPVYTYLTVPSVALFGLNESAVRLPNALVGTMAVVFTFLLTKEITKNKQVVILSTLLIAGSYWHIAMSRGAFEANLTTCFLTAGVYFFLKAREKSFLLPLSMSMFGINMFTYHSARIVTPLVVITLLWFYRKYFTNKIKYSLSSSIFLIFLIVAAISFIWGGSGIRASTSTIFSQDLGSGKIRANLVVSGVFTPVARALYNKPLFEVSKFLQNYTSYFSPDFLLTSGAREATYGMVPGIGVLSIVEFLGLLIFVIFMIRKPDVKLTALIIWLIISPIPAAISIGPGNAANRAVIMLPVIQIFAAIGIVKFLSLFKQKFLNHSLYLLSFVLIVFVNSSTLVRYVMEQRISAGYDMMFGMKEVFDFLGMYSTKHVVLSDSLSEGHIYAMFYDHIPPHLSQSESKEWGDNLSKLGLMWVDQQGTYFIGRYTLTAPQLSRFEENTIVVAKPEEMPKEVKILKTIYSPDIKPLYQIAEKTDKL